MAWNAFFANLKPGPGTYPAMTTTRQQTLKSLHHGIERCRKCRLSRDRLHAVPGEGPHDASVMFIGEGPGEQEDRTGKPFCGRAGNLFDELLGLIGLERREVYITSSVKCRPPRNRNPRQDEMDTCRQAWLETQIEIVAPQLIVLLGRIALRQVLNKNTPLGDCHGNIIRDKGRAILPTFHPAAGMRFPWIKRALKQDFQKISKEVHAHEPK